MTAAGVDAAALLRHRPRVNVVHEQPSGDERSELERRVIAAQGGDRLAFAWLHQRFGRMVHGILLARVPVHEADDLAQDVFLQAMERLSGLREPCAVGPWIARIARNRATDFFRRRRPTDALPDELPTRAPPSAEAREVLAALGHLPHAYRETLVLRLVEGMTGPEIAEATGLQPGSVRVNLHRGMKLLRERLGVETER